MGFLGAKTSKQVNSIGELDVWVIFSHENYIFALFFSKIVKNYK